MSTLRAALDKALEDVAVLPKDGATVQLAKRYADDLDNGADPIKMGPAYLACLESLGMTPRARAAMTGKGDPSSGTGTRALDQLRARRDARAN